MLPLIQQNSSGQLFTLDSLIHITSRCPCLYPAAPIPTTHTRHPLNTTLVIYPINTSIANKPDRV